jgi:hypothetical protein
MEEQTGAIRAGWYADPLGQRGMARYWDGAAWTRDVVPIPERQREAGNVAASRSDWSGAPAHDRGDPREPVADVGWREGNREEVEWRSETSAPTPRARKGTWNYPSASSLESSQSAGRPSPLTTVAPALSSLPSSLRNPASLAIAALVALVAMLVTGGFLLRLLGTGSGDYAMIDELKADYVKAGGSCADWKQNSGTPKPGQQAWACDGDTVLILFSDPDGTQPAARDLARTLAEYGQPVSLLVGDNWIVNSPHAEYVRKDMGGELYTSLPGS